MNESFSFRSAGNAMTPERRKRNIIQPADMASKSMEDLRALLKRHAPQPKRNEQRTSNSIETLRVLLDRQKIEKLRRTPEKMLTSTSGALKTTANFLNTARTPERKQKMLTNFLNTSRTPERKQMEQLSRAPEHKPTISANSLNISRTPERKQAVQLRQSTSTITTLSMPECGNIFNDSLTVLSKYQQPSVASSTTAPIAQTIISEESIKLWIHCNYCFEPFIKRRRSIYIHSCHHLICQNCLEQVPKPPNNDADSPCFKCRVCKKTQRIQEVGNNMPKVMKAMFHPMPWESDGDLRRIYNFQKFHRQHLNESMIKMRQKYKKLQELCTQLREAAKADKTIKRSLYIENRKLAAQVRKIVVWKDREKVVIAQLKSQLLPPTPESSVEGSIQSSSFVAQRCLVFASNNRKPEQPLRTATSDNAGFNFF